MIPDCWTPACVLQERVTAAAAGAAESAAEAVLLALATPITLALQQIFLLLISWLLVPAVDVLSQCAAWVEPGGSAHCSQSPSQLLRQWMLPVTGLVLLGGLIWQGVVTAVTRKGTPLLQAAKGLVTAATWGAIGIAGTQLALRAGDQYSCWIIAQSLGSTSGACDRDGIARALLLDDAVGNLSILLLMGNVQAPVLTIVFGLIVLFIVLAQLVLLVFREASIVILAGLLQLSAAGTVTRGSSGGFQKVVSWTLTLVAYKPIVATVYAVAFLLLGDPDQDTALRHPDAAPTSGDGAVELRWMILGLAMLVLSLVALPAAQKFFSWPVGHVSGGGGGGQALAGAAMSGMYAVGARGAGGSSASDQARATEQSLPTPPGAGRSGAATPSTPPPPAGATGAGTTGAGTAAAGASTSGGATAGAGAAGAAGGASAAGAAGGPVGLAAVAVVQGGQQAKAAVQNKATQATGTGD